MYERLLNKEQEPTLNEMLLYCGENGGRFSALNDYISEKFNTVSEIRFPYGKKYGWCITHRKGKKLICDIFAENEAFCVMLRLSKKHFEQIYTQLLDYTKKYIDNYYPCGDGGWIHYRVLCDEHLSDIEKLLSEKCR